ncbi:MAG: hypothetical protein ACREQA_20900 [Candidatus Binatia bacterium]
MAVEEKTKATGVDFTEFAKVWKEAYLIGLQVGLKLQEENERLTKTVVNQGMTAYQQWLTLYKNLTDTSLDQIQGQATASPFIALSRQMVQAIQANAEPALRTGAEVCEKALNSYETAVAGPSRKFVFEINKNVMDTVVPA